MSICRQFHQRFQVRFSYTILAPKISKPNIIREKLLNLLSYEKRLHKMLMKLTPGVNFTNIFCARFSLAKQNVTRKKTFVWKTRVKNASENVGEIDPWGPPDTCTRSYLTKEERRSVEVWRNEYEDIRTKFPHFVRRLQTTRCEDLKKYFCPDDDNSFSLCVTWLMERITQLLNFASPSGTLGLITKICAKHEET